MRKIVFALLILLFLLIINCVYQKTYTLYAIQTTQQQTPVSIIDKHTTHMIKKKRVSVTVKEPKKEPLKAKQKHPKTASKPTPQHTQNIQTPTTTQKVIPKSLVIKKPKAMTTKHLVEKKIHKDKTKTVLTQNVISHTPTIPKKEILKEEGKAIDYLLAVLKEHKDALYRRDEAISQLHLLIQRVLEERKQAIATMQTVSKASIEAQHKRIERRDHALHTDIENHTKGE